MGREKAEHTVWKLSMFLCCLSGKPTTWSSKERDFCNMKKKMLKKLYNFQNDFYRKEHFWMFNEAQSPPAMNIKGRPHVTIKEPGEG